MDSQVMEKHVSNLSSKGLTREAIVLENNEQQLEGQFKIVFVGSVETFHLLSYENA